MKVAILLPGLTRNYLESYNNLKENLLDKYDCDIFISTWDITGKFNRNKGEKNYNKQYINEKEYIDINDIISLYKPKSICMDCFEEFKITNKERIQKFMKKNNFTSYTKNLNSIFSQWYKIKNVFSLYYEYSKKNSIKYDFIIKLRFDVIFKPINLNYLIKNNVYFLKYWGKDVNLFGLQDYIFLSRDENYMLLVCNLYNFICNDNINFNDKKYILPQQGLTGPISELILADYVFENKISYFVLNLHSILI